MKPFEYVKATSLEHACQLLNKYGERAKILAGGQSLLVLLKERLVIPECLIDIKGLQDLEYVKANSGGIAIGALTTHRALETSPLIAKELPMLVDMERVVGWTQIRNWGTVGGDLCHADPAGDPSVALMALDAKVKLLSLTGNREIPLEEFFTGYLETVLEPDEILVEIIIPRLAAKTQGAYVKESVRPGDYGIATAAAVVTLEGKVIKNARIVLGAAGPTPKRAKRAEDVIVGKKIDSSLEEVGEVAAGESEPTSDVEGSAEYKREIMKVVTRKALTKAISRAQETSTIRGSK